MFDSNILCRFIYFESGIHPCKTLVLVYYAYCKRIRLVDGFYNLITATLVHDVPPNDI